MANKIFYTIFILLILGSIGITFWRIVIQKDYQIIAEVSCDPTQEGCFVRQSESCATDDTACLANPPTEVTNYKTISKKADTIYNCEQTTAKLGCDSELSCQTGELNCSYTLCSADNVPEGESCSE